MQQCNMTKVVHIPDWIRSPETPKGMTPKNKKNETKFALCVLAD